MADGERPADGTREVEMRNVVRSSTLAAAALTATAGSGLAEEAGTMTLVPGPAAPFVLRVRFPPGTAVAPHWHATAENLTVLSGALFHEMGDKLDKGRGD